MSNDARVDEVLTFWVGAPGEDRRALWFTKDAAVDAEIGRRFGPLIGAAAAGELDRWTATPRGALALVIVLDQFSRNVFRDTPGAFANDGRALAIAEQAIASGLDRALDWSERYMLRMPFMHGEAVATQRASVATFTALHAEAAAAGAPAAILAVLASAVDFAERHAGIVERFGRYPHRNAILGRPSTAEETTFLTQPGSGF